MLVISVAGIYGVEVTSFIAVLRECGFGDCMVNLILKHSQVGDLLTLDASNGLCMVYKTSLL
jgi:hypothetical protein